MYKEGVTMVYHRTMNGDKYVGMKKQEIGTI
jgi:hypothetical protein